jgi:arylformamidase
MKIIDISWPINTATTGYKDKHIMRIEDVKNFNRDGVRDTSIHLSSHTGTHVDAPSHFLRDGKTIDEMDLAKFIGRCHVLDLVDVDNEITGEHLAAHTFHEGDIVLLRTTNSDRNPIDKFNPHFIYLGVGGANYLVQKKIKAVGIDYLGIERDNPDHTTHTTLFHADIGIIEGLRLGHVTPGVYELICLPLAVIGTEAAPARAILMNM